MQAFVPDKPNQMSEQFGLDTAADRNVRATHLLRQALALLASTEPVSITSLITSHTPTNRLLRLPEVERLTGLRRSAIYQQMQQGTFPRSVKVGLRAATWSEIAIQAWITDRLEGRPTNHASGMR